MGCKIENFIRELRENKEGKKDFVLLKGRKITTKRKG